MIVAMRDKHPDYLIGRNNEYGSVLSKTQVLEMLSDSKILRYVRTTRLINTPECRNSWSGRVASPYHITINRKKSDSGEKYAIAWTIKARRRARRNNSWLGNCGAIRGPANNFGGFIAMHQQCHPYPRGRIGSIKKKIRRKLGCHA